MQSVPIFSLPCPKLGDAVERQNLNGREEEALIVSIIYHKADKTQWQAVLSTRSGIEFMSSDKEHRGINDWRPRGWKLDESTNSWLPEGKTWDFDNQKLVDKPTPTKKARKSGRSSEVADAVAAAEAAV